MIKVNGHLVAGRGRPGAAGVGVPSGGSSGQILAKASGNDYDTSWVNPTSGGASGVASFNGRSGAVTPQSGDYTAGMVGARPDTWTPTAADVGAVTGQGVQTIQAMTQEEYDALTQKSGTTMYIIKE